MSLHQQARQLIDQAEIAIKADNAQYATELLRQSILYSPKDPDAYILLGIALAQTGMAADAENAFKKATNLAPDNVKARYNLAVHQYSEGQVRAALNSARKAAEIDVRHSGAKGLVSRIEGELGIRPGEEPRTTAAGNPTPLVPREGYEPHEVATIPFVERLGAGWIAIGWVISALSLTGAILVLLTASPHVGQDFTKELMNAMGADPRVRVATYLFIPSALLSIVWTGMDAVHRRGNLLWMLPQIFCGFTGFTWLILPIYILLGRREIVE